MKNSTHFKMRLLPSLVVIAIVVGASSFTMIKSTFMAGAPALGSGPTPHPASDADIAFMAQATEIYLEEIRLSEVALEKGKKMEIRELGKKLTTEHYKSLLDLTTLAARKNIAIPIGLGDKENMDYEKLNHMSGEALDREYAYMMVTEHRDAIIMFEKESTGATDPDIRQWAAATLPEMHTHLDHAISAQNVLPMPGDSTIH